MFPLSANVQNLELKISPLLNRPGGSNLENESLTSGTCEYKFTTHTDTLQDLASLWLVSSLFSTGSTWFHIHVWGFSSSSQGGRGGAEGGGRGGGIFILNLTICSEATPSYPPTAPLPPSSLNDTVATWSPCIGGKKQNNLLKGW